jgi:hypothetical protein
MVFDPGLMMPSTSSEFPVRRFSDMYMDSKLSPNWGKPHSYPSSSSSSDMSPSSKR